MNHQHIMRLFILSLLFISTISQYAYTRTTTSHYYIIRIRQKHFLLKELNKKITGQRKKHVRYTSTNN